MFVVCVDLFSSHLPHDHWTHEDMPLSFPPLVCLSVFRSRPAPSQIRLLHVFEVAPHYYQSILPIIVVLAGRTTRMKIRGSVVSKSFIFPHPPEDKRRRKKKIGGAIRKLCRRT